MKKTNLGDIFLNNLKVENQLKEISSIFTENIYTDKINYKPYFQREYVWDLDKATYLIESILLSVWCIIKRFFPKLIERGYLPLSAQSIFLLNPWKVALPYIDLFMVFNLFTKPSANPLVYL